MKTLLPMETNRAIIEVNSYLKACWTRISSRLALLWDSSLKTSSIRLTGRWTRRKYRWFTTFSANCLLLEQSNSPKTSSKRLLTSSDGVSWMFSLQLMSLKKALMYQPVTKSFASMNYLQWKLSFRWRGEQDRRTQSSSLFAREKKKIHSNKTRTCLTEW